MVLQEPRDCFCCALWWWSNNGRRALHSYFLYKYDKNNMAKIFREEINKPKRKINVNGCWTDELLMHLPMKNGEGRKRDKYVNTCIILRKWPGSITDGTIVWKDLQVMCIWHCIWFITFIMEPHWVYHCLYVHFNHTKAICARHRNIPEEDRPKFFAVTLDFINGSISQ